MRLVGGGRTGWTCTRCLIRVGPITLRLRACSFRWLVEFDFSNVELDEKKFPSRDRISIHFDSLVRDVAFDPALVEPWRLTHRAQVGVLECKHHMKTVQCTLLTILVQGVGNGIVFGPCELFTSERWKTRQRKKLVKVITDKIESTCQMLLGQDMRLRRYNGSLPVESNTDIYDYILLAEGVSESKTSANFSPAESKRRLAVSRFVWIAFLCIYAVPNEDYQGVISKKFSEKESAQVSDSRVDARDEHRAFPSPPLLSSS
jgi:hypothetical protein